MPRYYECVVHVCVHVRNDSVKWWNFVQENSNTFTHVDLSQFITLHILGNYVLLSHAHNHSYHSGIIIGIPGAVSID